jgi:hypothetical protein
MKSSRRPEKLARSIPHCRNVSEDHSTLFVVRSQSQTPNGSPAADDLLKGFLAYDFRDKPADTLVRASADVFEDGAICEHDPVLPVSDRDHLVQALYHALKLAKSQFRRLTLREIHHRGGNANDLIGLVPCRLIGAKKRSCRSGVVEVVCEFDVREALASQCAFKIRRNLREFRWS